MPPTRGRRARRGQRGWDSPRDRDGRRGWGGQQGGIEASREDIDEGLSGDHSEAQDASDDMPTFRLLSPGTSQFSQLATLSIAGVDIPSYDWDAYFLDLPGTFRDVEDCPVRDVHNSRRLSYGSDHVSIFPIDL